MNKAEALVYFIQQITGEYYAAGANNQTTVVPSTGNLVNRWDDYVDKLRKEKKIDRHERDGWANPFFTQKRART